MGCCGIGYQEHIISDTIAFEPRFRCRLCQIHFLMNLRLLLFVDLLQRI